MSFVPELQNVTAGNSISPMGIAVDDIVVKTCLRKTNLWKLDKRLR